MGKIDETEASMSEQQMPARKRATSNPRHIMISIGLVLAGFTTAMLARKYIPGFSNLPREQQKTYLVIGLIAANILGFIVYRMWKARRARKSGSI
jgi:hypothetical protein